MFIFFFRRRFSRIIYPVIAESHRFYASHTKHPQRRKRLRASAATSSKFCLVRVIFNGVFCIRDVQYISSHSVRDEFLAASSTRIVILDILQRFSEFEVTPETIAPVNWELRIRPGHFRIPPDENHLDRFYFRHQCWHFSLLLRSNIIRESLKEI